MDLDNTLWGGIISEDGFNEIEVGNDSAVGEMYSEIQRYIKQQKNLGVVLAINSKNDLSDVELAFSHSDMNLKLEDFSVIDANWNNKNDNIIDIAEKLNIGLDSIVFVDDNPAERMIVKKELPMVAIPEIDEPERYIKIINGAGYFEVTNLTEEDRMRTLMYRSIEISNEERNTYTDYGEFLKSLNMESSIKQASKEKIQRITQLINKSNQFNLTTKRFTEDEVEKIIKDKNYICLYGRLKDRFGDYGIVSIIIARKEEKKVHIELFLMSCRVLKRGMEGAMMDRLFHMLNSSECNMVLGYYYKTKKNSMVEDLYLDMGFELQECSSNSKIFVISKENYKKKNKYIRIV